MKHLLTNSELSVISGQLAIILHSGISSMEGLAIMRDDLPDGAGKDILSAVCEELEISYDLTEAFRKTSVFPDYFIKMTEIGDRSGTLEDVMTELSAFYARQDTLLKNIRDALLYPLILLSMLLAVLTVLMTQVMPVFRQVFAQLGVEMTGSALSVFQFSNIMQYLSIILLIIVLGTAFYVFFALRFEHQREWLLQKARQLPLFRHIVTNLAVARLTNALSLALHSGLDLGESFSLASSFVTEEALKSKVKTAASLIEQGEDLSEALKSTGIITGLHARMLSIGFKTGSAETVFRQIASDCQLDADTRLQNAVNMLEPALTALLSILTGLILLSVMLPLLSVMANIG